jgi:hypothetical protein
MGLSSIKGARWPNPWWSRNSARNSSKFPLLIARYSSQHFALKQLQSVCSTLILRVHVLQPCYRTGNDKYNAPPIKVGTYAHYSAPLTIFLFVYYQIMISVASFVRNFNNEDGNNTTCLIQTLLTIYSHSLLHYQCHLPIQIGIAANGASVDVTSCAVPPSATRGCAMLWGQGSHITWVIVYSVLKTVRYIMLIGSRF